MSPLRMLGSTSGYAELAPSAVAGDQTFTLPGTGGTLDRLNRAGNVLQVVNATYSTETGRSSSTFADTGLTASITPTSASSKILVLVNQAGCGKETNTTSLRLRLLKDSTVISDFEKIAGGTGTSAASYIGSCSVCYLDSPATTSAVTYKTQFASSANVSVVYIQTSSAMSTITLLEIAA